MPQVAEIPNYFLATRGRIDKELAEFFFTETEQSSLTQEERDVLFKGMQTIILIF
jgi:hypothetical protein